MSCFQSKMHEIGIRLQLYPRLRWGTYSAERSPRYPRLKDLLLGEELLSTFVERTFAGCHKCAKEAATR